MVNGVLPTAVPLIAVTTVLLNAVFVTAVLQRGLLQFSLEYTDFVQGAAARALQRPPDATWSAQQFDAWASVY